MGFLSVLAVVSGMGLVMSLGLSGLPLILVLAYMLTVPIARFSIIGEQGVHQGRRTTGALIKIIYP